MEEKCHYRSNEISNSITDLIVQMNTYIGSQEYRDLAQKEMRDLTLKNTDDINQLKSSLKSVEDKTNVVSVTVDKIDTNLDKISDNLKDMDRAVLSKDEVKDIVKHTLLSDKNISNNAWFSSLPAKVSAGVAVLTFITFFTIKIVMILLTF